LYCLDNEGAYKKHDFEEIVIGLGTGTGLALNWRVSARIQVAPLEVTR
jgi:hypothetical protein